MHGKKTLESNMVLILTVIYSINKCFNVSFIVTGCSLTLKKAKSEKVFCTCDFQ